MLRDKIAAMFAALVIAAGYCMPAKADGLPKSGMLPIGEVAKVAPGSWTGFYVGAHAGYGWSNFDGSMIYTDATNGDGFDSSGKTLKGQGAIAGGQVGFNWQAGAVVWGVEADASWARIDGGAMLLPYPNNYDSPAWDFSTSIDWLATVRGRLGFASGKTLIYATGGVAFAGIQTSHDVVGPGYSAYGSKSENLIGWTVGGGLEWMLAPNWTLKTEYLYYRFDDVGGILSGMQSTSCDAPCPHHTDGFGGDLDIHTIRAGLNYKF